MATSCNPPDIWQPFGAFSMPQLPGNGQIVYLKGQVALDRDGNVVGVDDMRAQVRKTLENIEAALAFVGGKMPDIVSLVQYATDIEQFMACGDIRAAYFAEPYPVTTTVEVSRLYAPALMIEITATAEVPRERFKQP